MDEGRPARDARPVVSSRTSDHLAHLLLPSYHTLHTQLDHGEKLLCAVERHESAKS